MQAFTSIYKTFLVMLSAHTWTFQMQAFNKTFLVMLSHTHMDISQPTTNITLLTVTTHAGMHARTYTYMHAQTCIVQCPPKHIMHYHR